MTCESIREMFATIDRREWNDLPRYFAPDVIYFRPGYAPIRGLGELELFYREVRTVADGEHTIANIVMTGNAAACWGRFQGRSRDGRELDEQFADVYELVDGLVCVRTTYFFRAAI